MHILILSEYFYPEKTGIPPLLTALARDLVAAGDQVTVLTAFPHYPERVIPPAYRGKRCMKEELFGVTVYRTFTWVNPETSGFLKILHEGAFCLACLLGAFKVGRPDVVFCVSPPLALGPVAWLIRLLKRAPIVFNVQDLLPDAAVTFGLVKSKAMILALRCLERFNYWASEKIAVISQGFYDNIAGKGVAEDKLELIMNWVDVEHIRPMPRDNAFRRKNDFGDSFVVMYAGNIGYSQGLETILEAAKLLEHDPEILFVLNGAGTRKQALEEQARAMGLSNVRFLPVAPEERLPELLASADLHLVVQKRDVVNLNLPSKIMGIMAAGRPMIASVNPANDSYKILAEAECGAWVEPEDPALLAETVSRLKEEPENRERYGVNGRRYAEKHLARSAIVPQYRRIFEQVVQEKPRKRT